VSDPRRWARLLTVAIVLALVFNLMALVALIRATPIIFTLFMFVAQPLIAVALIILVGAVVAGLRARSMV
jgi:hypothetical protein